jgi:hypothetical protein
MVKICVHCSFNMPISSDTSTQHHIIFILSLLNELPYNDAL